MGVLTGGQRDHKTLVEVRTQDNAAPFFLHFSSIIPLHGLTPAPCRSSRASRSDSSSPRRMWPRGRRYSPFNTPGRNSGAKGSCPRAKSTGLFFFFFPCFPGPETHYRVFSSSFHCFFPGCGVLGVLGAVVSPGARFWYAGTGFVRVPFSFFSLWFPGPETHFRRLSGSFQCFSNGCGVPEVLGGVVSPGGKGLICGDGICVSPFSLAFYVFVPGLVSASFYPPSQFYSYFPSLRRSLIAILLRDLVKFFVSHFFLFPHAFIPPCCSCFHGGRGHMLGVGLQAMFSVFRVSEDQENTRKRLFTWCNLFLQAHVHLLCNSW